LVVRRPSAERSRTRPNGRPTVRIKTNFQLSAIKQIIDAPDRRIVRIAGNNEDDLPVRRVGPTSIKKPYAPTVLPTRRHSVRPFY
jgi:hypothetical protein